MLKKKLHSPNLWWGYLGEDKPTTPSSRRVMLPGVYIYIFPHGKK